MPFTTDSGQSVAGTPGQTELANVTTIASLTPVELATGERLRVVATTDIVADVVAQVGGDAIHLTSLLPPGADPHSFTATPRDLADLAGAHLLVVNGFDLEAGLGGVLETVAGEVPVISISEGVVGLAVPGADPASEPAGSQGEPEPDQPAGIDPHVWFDPTIVMTWARNASAALSAQDPAGKAGYEGRSGRYVQALHELDAWVMRSVATIPPDRRALVTDHLVLGYFARRYGFEVLGAVIPAYSSGASAAPRELAELLGTIERHGVEAVFVGMSANPGAAQSLARDAGIQVVPLYTGSLGEADGPAATYVGMMEFNVRAVVEALGGEVAVSPGPTSAATPAAAPMPDPVGTVTAAQEGRLVESHPSPDGRWVAQVLVYDCVLVADEGEVAYQELRLVDLESGQERLADSQLQYCGGLGAVGLAGRFWSANSRYFYYTNASTGVPDGCGFFSSPHLRLEVDSMAVEYLGMGPVSPDRLKLAVWWEGQGDVRAQGMLAIWAVEGELLGVAALPPPVVLAGPIAWSPDSQSVAFLTSLEPCPLGATALGRMELDFMVPATLLQSSAPSFAGLAWETADALTLTDEQGGRWTYEFGTGRLLPATP